MKLTGHTSSMQQFDTFLINKEQNDRTLWESAMKNYQIKLKDLVKWQISAKNYIGKIMELNATV